MSSEKDALNHAWNYFVLHANQRITVFNYFVVFSGIIATGLASTIQTSSGRLSSVGILLGTLLIALSFLFWKLDQRTSFLIKHAEDQIKLLEPQSASLFLTEVEKTRLAKAEGQWSYGKTFRVIFAIMGAVGSAGALFSALRLCTKLGGCHCIQYLVG